MEMFFSLVETKIISWVGLLYRESLDFQAQLGSQASLIWCNYIDNKNNIDNDFLETRRDEESGKELSLC